jgi:hypothetical protein
MVQILARGMHMAREIRQGRPAPTQTKSRIVGGSAWKKADRPALAVYGLADVLCQLRPFCHIYAFLPTDMEASRGTGSDRTVAPLTDLFATKGQSA